LPKIVENITLNLWKKLFIILTIGLLLQNTQHKVYFANLFLNYWNFGKLNSKVLESCFLKCINSLCQLVEKCQLSRYASFWGKYPIEPNRCLVDIPIQVILGFASLFGNTQLKQMASCSYFNSSHFRVCIFFGKYPNWSKYIVFIISICQFMVCMFLGDLPNWRSHLTLSCFCWLFPRIVIV
jgi:hypothetical protein